MNFDITAKLFAWTVPALPGTFYRNGYFMGTSWVLYGYFMGTSWVFYGYFMGTPK